MAAVIKYSLKGIHMILVILFLNEQDGTLMQVRHIRLLLF